MKVSFGMIFRSDEEQIASTISKVPRIFDEYIFLDTGSTDNSRQLIKARFPNARFITADGTHYDFGTWRNTLMDESRKLLMDWVFQLDTDEAMFESHYKILFQYMVKDVNDCLRCARINMVKKTTYLPEFFPDFQARAIKLSSPMRYTEPYHAQPKLNGETVKGLFLPHVVIYHFGWTKIGVKNWLKHENYERSLRGEPVLTSVPPGTVIPADNWGNREQPFYGEIP